MTGPTANVPIEGHDPCQGTIFCAAFNNAGNEFATGSADHSVRVWETGTCRCRRELFKQGGHREWVVTLDYLSDDSIVSGSMDNQILLWRRGSAKSAQIGLHESCAKLVSIGNAVVSVGYDGYVRAFSPRGEVASLAVDRQLCHLIALPNSRFAVGSRSGAVALVEFDGAFRLEYKVVAHKGGVVSLGACPDGSKDDFVSGGEDGRCALWRDGKNVWCSPPSKGTICFCTYDCGPDGDIPRIIYGTSAFEICICPLTAKANNAVLSVHTTPVCEGVLVDGILLTGDAEGKIICHRLDEDRRTGNAQLLWGFGALRMAVRCITVSADRRNVIVGGEEAVGMMLKFE
jgi:WD40 repeat protein